MPLSPASSPEATTVAWPGLASQRGIRKQLSSRNRASQNPVCTLHGLCTLFCLHVSLTSICGT